MAAASEKRILIDKANTSIFIAITLASAVLVFSAVSVKSMFTQSGHRSRVIKEKKLAAKTLTDNDKEVGKLIDSYKAFENAPESVIRTADKNSKIVLDSLPPKYDFPALASSLEKILTEGGYGITGISGSDNELANKDLQSAEPVPVEMPFTLSVSGDYTKVKALVADLERSIRPIYLTNITLSGSETDAKLSVTAKTYYQPGKNLEISSKVVK
jgi:Tfp pilus assembly protein PilO